MTTCHMSEFYENKVSDDLETESGNLNESPERRTGNFKMEASVSSKKRKRRLKRMFSSSSNSDRESDKENETVSISDNNCLTLPREQLGRRSVAPSAHKVRRSLCLEKLKEQRQLKQNGAQSCLERKKLDLQNPSVDAICISSDANESSQTSTSSSNDNTRSFIAEDDSSQDLQEVSEHSSQTSTSSSNEEESQDLQELEHSSQTSTSSSNEEDEDSMSTFIVEDDSSQDLQELEHEIMLFKKPSMKEAFTCYVDMVLTKHSTNDSARETESWFKKSKSLLGDNIKSRKDLVDSSAWCADFKRRLQNCRVLKDTPLPCTVKDTCQACRGPRHLKRLFIFSEGHNEESIQKFRIGCYCAERGYLYHRLHHYLSDELQTKCQKKFKEVKELMENTSTEEIVRCCMNEEWLNEAFKSFQFILNEADKWAEDGEKRRQMKEAVSKFN